MELEQAKKKNSFIGLYYYNVYVGDGARTGPSSTTWALECPALQTTTAPDKNILLKKKKRTKTFIQGQNQERQVYKTRYTRVTFAICLVQ